MHTAKKVTVVSMAIISALNMAMLIYIAYASLISERFLNLFAPMLWFALTAWCLRALLLGSKQAIIWARILFIIFIVLGGFYFLFPLDWGPYYRLVDLGLLVMFISSLLGLISSFFGR